MRRSSVILDADITCDMVIGYKNTNNKLKWALGSRVGLHFFFFLFGKLDCEHYGLNQIYYMVSSDSPRNHHHGGPNEARHRSDTIPQVMCNELNTCPFVTNFFLWLIICCTYVVMYSFWKSHSFFSFSFLSYINILINFKLKK